jgi:curved DNA-binding protein CbpA
VDAPILAPAASFYELLQVPPAATPEQLRQSFRRLSKRYHPDTTTLPVPVAEQAFQRLKRAYSVLSDPQARRLYDEQRSRIPPPAAARAAAPTTPFGSGQGAPVSLRRALSGGEWFALLLLALALLLSLVLGIGVAWARGAELVRWPSWWTDLHPAALASAGVSPEDGKVGTPQSPLLTADASDVPAS